MTVLEMIGFLNNHYVDGIVERKVGDAWEPLTEDQLRIIYTHKREAE